jgi:hypothetical protein
MACGSSFQSNCDGLSSAADEALAIINQLRNLHDLSLDDWHLRSKPEGVLPRDRPMPLTSLGLGLAGVARM